VHFCSFRLYIGEARLIAGREHEEGEARGLLMTVHHHVI